MIGVAASSASKGAILVAGVAGLVGGSMSMAVGEYVSVSAQRDAEPADVERETRELAGRLGAELNELALMYVKRGLDKDLAMKVAEQLSTRDRLGAHLQDGPAIDQESLARPMQAAWISAASFASFAVVPIVALLVAPKKVLPPRNGRPKAGRMHHPGGRTHRCDRPRCLSSVSRLSVRVAVISAAHRSVVPHYE